MGLLKLFIFGLLFAVGAYYLRIYMKGAACEIHTRIDGRTVLITGANTGIGFETAVELAARGGHVHMACRDRTKCEAARKRVIERSKVDPSLVVTHNLDLASFKSILSFSQSFKQMVPKLHILINNAGIMMCPYRETEDGFESQMGVNYFGHFLLTSELLSLVRAAESSRIVIVSAGFHELGSIGSEHLHLRGEKYGPLAAYSDSKVANILHAKALARRLKEEGVAVVSLHPGAIVTELQREWPTVFQRIFEWSELLLTKSAKEGAQTQICCAVDPNLIDHTGEYFSDVKPKASSNAQVYNETLSEWLWEVTEKIVSEKVSKL